MADSNDKRPVLASLLDRLTDDDPDKGQEIPVTGRKLERQLREAIRRDVELFLNTRRRCTPIPEGLNNVEGTIMDYGIPDFLGQTLTGDRRRNQFLRELSDFLKEHEPRFKEVEVESIGIDQIDRSLQFRIEAVVYAEPAPESLSFDSQVEPVSRSFNVKV